LEAEISVLLDVEFGEAVRSREATLDLDRLRARAGCARLGDEDLEVNLAGIVGSGVLSRNDYD
jgi:hypothetical protein